MSFIAKYHGTCRDCDDPIRPGEEIEMDDERNVLHVNCPDDTHGLTGKPLAVCPRCFCTIPVSGVCGVCE